MTLLEVLSNINITEFSSTDKTSIQNSITQLYNGSAPIKLQRLVLSAIAL